MPREHTTQEGSQRKEIVFKIPQERKENYSLTDMWIWQIETMRTHAYKPKVSICFH